MDLTTMQSRLRTRFRDANQDIYTNSDWTAYLNDAYHDVQGASPDWPFLKSSSSSLVVNAGQRSVALPSDAQKLTSVYNSTDKVKVEPMDGAVTPLVAWPDQTETGTPINYRVYGTNLQVFPLPSVNTTFAVEYRASLVDLSGGTDVPGFPSRYHGMLIEGALMRAYTDDGNSAQAQVHQALFDGILGRMMADLLTGQQERYPSIVDDWYD